MCISVECSSHVPSPIAGKLLISFYTDKGILSPGTTSQIICAPESVTSITSSVGKEIHPTFQCFSDKGILSKVSSDPDSNYEPKSVTLFRETGVFRTLLLEGTIPVSMMTSGDHSVLICGIAL